MTFILTVYKLLIRTLLTRGRLILLLLLGLVGVGIGIAIGASSSADHLDAGTRLVNSFALSLYAPVATLVFASACSATTAWGPASPGPPRARPGAPT